MTVKFQQQTSPNARTVSDFRNNLHYFLKELHFQYSLLNMMLCKTEQQQNSV